VTGSAAVVVKGSCMSCQSVVNTYR